MNVAQLKRLGRSGDVSARVISDGCRDYVVQIEHGASRGLLCNRLNRPLRFKSLTQAHALLARYNVTDVLLTVRIADDEVGQTDTTRAAFNDLPLAATTH